MECKSFATSYLNFFGTLARIFRATWTWQRCTFAFGNSSWKTVSNPGNPSIIPRVTVRLSISQAFKSLKNSVLMTMSADIFYIMPAKMLRGFAQFDTQKIFRHFIRGGDDVDITSGEVKVTYAHRAYNPILRDVPWQKIPQTISWLNGIKLILKLQLSTVFSK